MPQPVIPLISVDFSPMARLKRSDLTARIGVIAGISNEIDTRLALLLAALIGAEAKTVLSIYLSLTGATAKRAAMQAASALRLNHTQQLEFSTILTKIGKRARERSTVIHSAWGISDQHPEALIRADPRDLIFYNIDMVIEGRHRREADGSILLGVMARLRDEQKNWKIYKLEDFEEIEDRLRTVLVEFSQFSSQFMTPYFQGILHGSP